MFLRKHDLFVFKMLNEIVEILNLVLSKILMSNGKS